MPIPGKGGDLKMARFVICHVCMLGLHAIIYATVLSDHGNQEINNPGLVVSFHHAASIIGVWLLTAVPVQSLYHKCTVGCSALNAQ